MLLVRTVFFGISLLDRNTSLTLSSAILSIVNALHGLCRPFKSKANNYQYMLLITNILVMHTLVLSGLGATSTVITTMISLAIIQQSSTIAYHIIFLCAVKFKLLNIMKHLWNKWK